MQTVSFREGKPTKFLRDSDGDIFFPIQFLQQKSIFFVTNCWWTSSFPQVSWEQTTPQKKLRCISNFRSTNSLQHLPYPKNHEISSHWLFGDVWRSQTPAGRIQTIPNPSFSQGPVIPRVDMWFLGRILRDLPIYHMFLFYGWDWDHQSYSREGLDS